MQTTVNGRTTYLLTTASDIGGVKFGFNTVRCVLANYTVSVSW
jgi:hypothetical protein